MADQHAGAAVGEDVGDLLGLEVPVDRHRIGAERLRGVGRLDEGDVVAHQDGDAIAGRDAEREQARRDAPHPAVELGCGRGSGSPLTMPAIAALMPALSLVSDRGATLASPARRRQRPMLRPACHSAPPSPQVGCGRA